MLYMKERKSQLPSYISIITVIASCFVVFYMIRVASGDIRFIRISGSAMSPTIEDGDIVILSKADRMLERGKIVIISYPSDQSRKFIGRIIGLPGDNIEILRGKITINGNLLDENYLDNTLNDPDTSTFALSQVPQDKYFILGDNRRTAYDSRNYGFVPRGLIHGTLIKLF